MSQTETLLVELGTEELPPKSLKALGLAFRDGILAGLQQRELSFGAVQWFASPRRLAVLVESVALQAEDREVETLGPPAAQARDEAGEWKPAALGFARKQGVEPGQLQVIETPKGPRLGLRSTQAGARTRDCLNEIDRVRPDPLGTRCRGPARCRPGGRYRRPLHHRATRAGLQ